MSMQSILSASLSLANMQAVQSASTKMQGQANVLRAESKQDGGNAEKDQKATELEKQSSALAGNMMEELKDVNGSLNEPTDEPQVDPSKDSATQAPNQDRVEISKDPQDSQDGEKAVAAKAEPVAYTAQGETVKAAPAPTGEKVDAKA